MKAPPAFLSLAALSLSGCVVVPITVESFDPDCRVVTHHMELQQTQVNAMARCNDNGCAAVLLGVEAASLIVSGSIVVLGNVAYWAEHRANCVLPAAPPASAVSS